MCLGPQYLGLVAVVELYGFIQRVLWSQLLHQLLPLQPAAHPKIPELVLRDKRAVNGVYVIDIVVLVISPQPRAVPPALNAQQLVQVIHEPLLNLLVLLSHPLRNRGDAELVVVLFVHGILK